jgi:hypothetical protein
MVTACLLDQKTRDKKAKQELDREQQEKQTKRHPQQRTKA